MSEMDQDTRSVFEAGFVANFWINHTRNPSKMIAGFLRRVVAFLFDVALLAILGLILEVVLFDVFVKMHGWGRLLGFFIAGAYFGFLDSSLTRGQTIGKHLFNVRLVDTEGNLVSVLRAFLRYAIIAAPYFLFASNLVRSFSVSGQNSFVAFFTVNVSSFIIFGITLSALYLLLFNRAQGQSLHDLLTGTVVLNATSRKMPELGSIWGLHYFIVAGLMFVAIILPSLMGKLSDSEDWDAMLKVEAELQEQPAVYMATMMGTKETLNPFSKNRIVVQGVAFGIWVDEDLADYQNLADRVAYLILTKYPEIQARQLLEVRIEYGYDIGIGSGGKLYEYKLTFEQWKKRLGTKSPMRKNYLDDQN